VGGRCDVRERKEGGEKEARKISRGWQEGGGRRREGEMEERGEEKEK